MKPKIFIILVILFGSILTYAQEVVNMYPNYQPGAESVINHIITSGYGISRAEISPIMPLEVNGQIRQGTVKSKWNNKADIDLYQIEVHKEGLLSIVANPLNYDNKKGSLHLNIFTNDNRREGGTVLNSWMIQSNQVYQRDDGWSIRDSYSFYAYPGTYYLKVDGKYGDEKGKSDYIPLVYQIGVIQDDSVNSYSGNLGKNTGAYKLSNSTGYPTDLGSTTLTNSIDIVSSLNLEHWIRRKNNSLFARKSPRTYTNTKDEFWFYPSTSGKVYFHLSSFSSKPMDVWQRAWRKANKKNNLHEPKFRLSVLHLNVKNHVLANQETGFDGSLDVLAGGKYRVTIHSERELPVYYRLYISYSNKIPPLKNVGETDADVSIGDINEHSDQFDPIPNEIRNNKLNGIWGDNYIALQIEGNKGSLYQTTDIDFWQNHNIDIGGLTLKNIQKKSNNTWQCDFMWLFLNTPYVLWMPGIIEMNSDGNSITIIKKNPCDGSPAYQTLNRWIK